MTGIVAILSTDGIEPGRLDAMTRAMERRAHDSIAHWHKGKLALGACNLYTTGEAQLAPQPWQSADGELAIVLDGYLTHPVELKSDLEARGVQLRNASDAELVLGAYRLWGEGCAERIHGEFAFVIADKTQDTVYAARDQRGLRPLFYCETPRGVLIASDLGAIVAALPTKPEPDWDYLAGVLACQIWMLDETPWKGISRLRQAHCLTASENGVRKQQYYHLPTDVSIRYRDESEYAEHYKSVLFDVMKRASRTHAPLGMTVSGGLDSSALFAVAHQLQSEGKLQAPSIKGYTLASEEGSDSYELPYARQVASHVGQPVTEVPLFVPDEPWYFEQAGRTRDIPTATNGSMSLLLEEQAVADGCRTLVSGDGGDEWLQGNGLDLRESLLEVDLRRFAKIMGYQVDYRGWPAALKLGLGEMVKVALPASLKASLRRRERHRTEIKKDRYFWMTHDMRRRVREQRDAHERMMPGAPGPSVKENLWSSPFAEFANATMQRQHGEVGLEIRHPMLLREFIEFSTQTPEFIKQRGPLRKIVHRNAMQGLLPDAVRNRESKAEFTSHEVDRQFAQFVVNSGREVLSEITDSDGLERLICIQSGETVDDDWSWELWSVYAVAAFLIQYGADDRF